MKANLTSPKDLFCPVGYPNMKGTFTVYIDRRPGVGLRPNSDFNALTKAHSEFAPALDHWTEVLSQISFLSVKTRHNTVNQSDAIHRVPSLSEQRGCAAYLCAE